MMFSRKNCGLVFVIVCGLGLTACATTRASSSTKAQSLRKPLELEAKIADNLPEMTFAQYMDCSIAASMMEKAAIAKGGTPVLERSKVWDLAAQKRSNPKTVSLDELLEEPKLMPLLKAMGDAGEISTGLNEQFASISDDCNEKFIETLNALKES